MIPDRNRFALSRFGGEAPVVDRFPQNGIGIALKILRSARARRESESSVRSEGLGFTASTAVTTE